ncbi:MAG: hypothetical protein WCH62_00810 [Candidatus Omnitrophota bacterium]
MTAIAETKLLKDKDVLAEINRHKWIESQKAGYDIGFERASREWIQSYSEKWLARRPNKTALLWLKSQPFIEILNKRIPC